MVDLDIPPGAMSLADCIEKLFGLKLSRFTKLKDALESMRRNGVIVYHQTAALGGKGSRGKVFYPREQLDTIFNAVILHGIFSDPRVVKEIFENPTKRQEMANWLESILMNRNSVVGVGLISQEVVRFFEILRSNADLRRTRLTNPFVELPQLSLGSVTSVMQGLLVQGAMLSSGDSMMVAYLNGELEKARNIAKNLKVNNHVLQQYKLLILREYEEAKEFDKTLDFFR